MRKKTDMSRLSLYVPTVLYNRIDLDSQKYGITKTALLQAMIVDYYRSVDSVGGAGFQPSAVDLARVKGQVCRQADDTP